MDWLCFHHSLPISLALDVETHTSQIVVPPLPGKALKRQLPFRGDEGIFDESFIEERRIGLEQFINRSAVEMAQYSNKKY